MTCSCVKATDWKMDRSSSEELEDVGIAARAAERPPRERGRGQAR